jgi:hypothetical protein
VIEIFREFGLLLEKRLNDKVTTTEDSVRYTFFAALLRHGVSPEQVVLECPHHGIDGARIDTWLPSYKDTPVAIEFKYDRDPPGGRNQPKTLKAGAIFKDLKRQALAAKKMDAKSYFVYVTTEEMAIYFNSPNNRHDRFWSLKQGSEMLIDEQYLLDRPKTFSNTVGGSFKAKVIMAYSKDFSNGWYLRVYQVFSD